MNDKIPKPVTPLIDPATGTISRPWFLYLASLTGDDASEDDDVLFWASLHT